MALDPMESFLSSILKSTATSKSIIQPPVPAEPPPTSISNMAELTTPITGMAELTTSKTTMAETTSMTKSRPSYYPLTTIWTAATACNSIIPEIFSGHVFRRTLPRFGFSRPTTRLEFAHRGIPSVVPQLARPSIFIRFFLPRLSDFAYQGSSRLSCGAADKRILT